MYLVCLLSFLGTEETSLRKEWEQSPFSGATVYFFDDPVLLLGKSFWNDNVAVGRLVPTNRSCPDAAVEDLGIMVTRNLVGSSWLFWTIIRTVFRLVPAAAQKVIFKFSCDRIFNLK